MSEIFIIAISIIGGGFLGSMIALIGAWYAFRDHEKVKHYES